MAFMDYVWNYVVPVVGGVFILIFIAIFVYVIHRVILKPLKIYDMFRNLGFSMRKKKLLADEKILEYCVTRIQNKWTEAQVREELLLSNKYSAKRVEEILYVFNTVKKEMQPDGKKKKVAEDLP